MRGERDVCVCVCEGECIVSEYMEHGVGVMWGCERPGNVCVCVCDMWGCERSV